MTGTAQPPTSNPILVVTADDLGLAEAVNRGIVRAHREGIVTQTSLMAVGEAFDDAVARVREVPTLGVGVHLTLIEERPRLAPERVPSLADGAGGFLPDRLAFLRRWARGGVRMAEVRAELEAQIERVLEADIRPTHLDGHDHLHVVPGILGITLELADWHGVPFVRVPEEVFSWGEVGVARAVLQGGLNVLARRARGKVAARALRTSDRFLGVSGAGALDAERLRAMVGRVEGVTELVCHPGEEDAATRARYGAWEFSWQDELAAVTDAGVRDALDARGVRLASFGELARA